MKGDYYLMMALSILLIIAGSISAVTSIRYLGLLFVAIGVIFVFKAKQGIGSAETEGVVESKAEEDYEQQRLETYKAEPAESAEEQKEEAEENPSIFSLFSTKAD